MCYVFLSFVVYDYKQSYMESNGMVLASEQERTQREQIKKTFQFP